MTLFDTTEKRILFALIVSAFLLRVVGVWYGLPSLYNSDEPFNVINALAYGAKQSLEPTYFVYPALHSYMLLALYGVYFILGMLFGFFESALEFGASYFLDPTGLFLIGRLFSVLLGTATVYLVYRIGMRLFNRRTGLLAAALLAFSFTAVERSHWVLLEPMTAFMVALALLFIFRYFETPTLKRSILAGVLCGLAIATKYNAGLIVLPMLLAPFFAFKSRPTEWAKHSAVSLLSVVAGFLLGSPYWLFEFSSYWRDFNYSVSHVGTGMTGHLSVIPGIWPLWELIFHDYGVGLFFVAGAFYALFQFRKKQVLLAILVWPTLLIIGLWSRTGVHYLMPIFPALALLGALFLDKILELKMPRVSKVVLLILIFTPTIVKTVLHDIRLTQTDTRTLAKEWIESNIQEDSIIGYENYVYGPNLFDPNRFFKNSEESALLPVELKERLLEEKRRRISYQLINLRKDFKLRLLSEREGMAVNDPYVRQLLEMRLPRLASVRKAGIDYLVLSSENYARYFTGPPPKQGTPLWLHYQNSRRFYRTVFESDDVTLLREFEPGFWNLGPTVRVYRVEPKQDE